MRPKFLCVSFNPPAPLPFCSFINSVIFEPEHPSCKSAAI